MFSVLFAACLSRTTQGMRPLACLDCDLSAHPDNLVLNGTRPIRPGVMPRRRSPSLITESYYSSQVMHAPTALIHRQPALLTSCIAGSTRQVPTLLDGLEILLSSYSAVIGGDAFVFTTAEEAHKPPGRNIHSVSEQIGASIWEVPKTSAYHGFLIPAGSVSRYVQYLEWVASRGPQYDWVIVSDCADVAFQSDPMAAPSVMTHPAQVLFVFEPRETRGDQSFLRQGETCYSKEFCNTVSSAKVQVNSGLWMGTPLGISLISERLLLEAVHCEDYRWDQHYLEVVAQMRFRIGSQVHVLGEDGFSGVMANLDKASDFVVGEDFLVLHARERQPVAVLHQYAWHPQMELALHAQKSARQAASFPAACRKIFIYPDISNVNARLRAAYVPTIEQSAWTTELPEFLAEVRIHEGLLVRKEWLTDDPDEADLFFIPCYAWLASHCFQHTEPLTAQGKDHCAALQKELMTTVVETLGASAAWQKGRPHVIVHGSALSRMEAFPFGAADLLSAPHMIVATVNGAVGDTLVSGYSPKLHDVIIPHSIPRQHITYIEQELTRRLSSEGWKSHKMVVCASPSHPVCEDLLKILRMAIVLNASMPIGFRPQSGGGPHHVQEHLALASGLTDALDATFCVVPQGTSSSAQRVQEAILALCIPIVVGDKEPLAYEDVLPGMARAAIFWAESQVKDLPRYLNGLPDTEILQQQKLMMDLRYKLLLEAPVRVRWGGLESLLLNLAQRVRGSPVSLRPRAGVPLAGVRSRDSMLPRAAMRRTATLSGSGLAVLTSCMPEESSFLGAGDGLLRLLHSLRAVDHLAHLFVIISDTFYRYVGGKDFFEQFNATALQFVRSTVEYRGMQLPPGDVARHALYTRVIQQHLLKFEQLVILDSKDTFFQAPAHELFIEGNLTGMVFAYQEPQCTSVRTYWESHAASCYKAGFYKSVADTEIVNGGILAGSPPALRSVSEMILEEARKCGSSTAFLKDQHYLDAVLFSIHSGLLTHEDAKVVHYVPHGEVTLNSNHPKDSEIQVDLTFRIAYKKAEGTWSYPVVLHPLSHRVNVLRATELRAANQREHARLRMCAYRGMHFEGDMAGAEPAQAQALERWDRGTILESQCDVWFVPLCGVLTVQAGKWATGLKWFRLYPHRHVYIWPSTSCRERADMQHLISTLESSSAVPISTNSVPHSSKMRPSHLSDAVLAAPLLSHREYSSATQNLVGALNKVATTEDAAGERLVLQDWKSTLLLHLRNDSAIGGQAGKSMADSTFCVLPDELSREWFVRAVLVLCIPVLTGRWGALPFEELFDLNAVALTWKLGTQSSIEGFVSRVPPTQVERMQTTLASYRAALLVHELGSQDFDLWEAIRLVLERRQVGGAGVLRHSPAGITKSQQRRYAYFLAPFDAHYVPGACRLLQSLSSVGTALPVIAPLVKGAMIPHDKIVELRLCGSGLPDLRFVEIEPYRPTSNGSTHASSGLSWTRLRYFGHDEFDRILQIEVDAVVRTNLDWVFELSLPSRLFAVPDCTACEVLREPPRPECLSMLRMRQPKADWEDARAVWKQRYSEEWEVNAHERCSDELPPRQPYRFFNVGVFLFQPDHEVFLRMQEELASAKQKDHFVTEQDFLNGFFKDWQSLPLQMNVQVREDTAETPLEDWSRDIAVLHWPGKVKPWAINQPLTDWELQPSLQAWFGRAEPGHATVSEQGRVDRAESRSPAPLPKGQCATLSKVLLLTCATDVNHDGYKQWKASVGEPQSKSMQVQNVCEGQGYLSSAARLALYHKAVEQLSKNDRHKTLVIQMDSYDAVANYLSIPQEDLIAELVRRYHQLSAQCNQIVSQAEFSCYNGRPCTLEEARPFSLRKGRASNLRNFASVGIMLGRASTMYSMEAALFKAVADLGIPLKHLSAQPLVHAYIRANPGKVVIDSHQLIIGGLQEVRLHPDGQTGGVNGTTEQCHAYRQGRNLGHFMCTSAVAPLVPCCLRTAELEDSLTASECTLLFTPKSTSPAQAHAPLFVHGEGPYKEILKRQAGKVLGACRHHKTMTFPREDSPAWMGYLVMLVVVIITVAFVHGRRGTLVTCRVLVYVFALLVTQRSAEFVHSTLGFAHPEFVSAIHFVFGTALGVSLILCKQRLTRKRVAVPTVREFCCVIVPTACGAAIAVLASNGALALCRDATWVVVFGATSPIMAALGIALMGHSFDWVLFLPLVLVVIGCCTSTNGQLRGLSALGALLCFLASIGRSFTGVMQQQLLSHYNSKFEPLTLLAWTCGPSAVVALSWSFLAEGMRPLHSLVSGPDGLKTSLAIAFSGSAAALLAYSGLWLVKDIGAVSAQTVGILQWGLTVVGGAVVLREPLTPFQVVGLVALLGGIWSYAHMEYNLQTRQKARSLQTAASVAGTPANTSPSRKSNTAPVPGAPAPDTDPTQAMPPPLQPALIRCVLYLVHTWCMYGVLMGLPNATLASMRQSFGFTPLQQGLFVGGPAFVIAFASPFIGSIAERMSRRRLGASAASIIAVGSIVWALAGSFKAVLAGRILHGLGLSLGLVVASLHAAEVVPSRLRGALCSSTDVFINIGIVSPWCWALIFPHQSDAEVARSWRPIVWVSAAQALSCLAANWLLATESPRWLAKHSSPEEANEAFGLLLNNIEAVQAMAATQQALRKVPNSKAAVEHAEHEETPAPAASVWSGLWGGPLRRPLLVSQAVGFFHHASGISIMVSFSSLLLESSFGRLEAERVTVIVGIGKIMALLTAAMLVDRLGRKPLLVTSLVLMSISYIAWALQSVIAPTSLVAVVTALLLNVCAFSIGVGPLNYVIPAEVWTQDHRDEGVAAAQMTCRLAEGTIALTVMPVLNLAGGHLWVVLCGFAAICMSGGILLAMVFQETKQQLLEFVSVDEQQPVSRKEMN